MALSVSSGDYQPILDESNHEEEESEEQNDLESIGPLHYSSHDQDVRDATRLGHTLRWDHIQNLDQFFTRVYVYHQRGGFLCMLLEEAFQLFQLAFIVCFSVYLMQCVKYEVLFQNAMSGGRKTKLSEAVYTIDYCAAHLNGWVVLMVVIASAFWLVWLVRVVMNTRHNWAMRTFYDSALGISGSDLANMTWHEVQCKLLDVQKDLQLSKQKAELTQLDIYNRILRFKNYTVAMVNKSVIPIKIDLPFIGSYIFFSGGLKFNLDILLFWGPWAPFENHWQLRSAYKRIGRRQELAQYLSGKFLLLGVLNLVLSPLILLWQILYSFFKYAELLKREPGLLGARRWSRYGRWYLRHFNELDHEFQARVNRAYSPAARYMNSFVSPIVVVFAKNVMFFAGALLAVLVLLTIIDEDTLHVEHVLTAITLLGIVVTICRSIIPDENLVWCPEALLLKCLSHCHYMPDEWKHRAHTSFVRNEFAQMFQYKVTYLLEEVLSPVVTPLLLIFVYSSRAVDIVDFLRNFTIEVEGVGDVCSFAQMDVRQHGHPSWLPPGTETAAESSQRAEDGKAELSLMHFHYTNPEWVPPEASRNYLDAVRRQASEDSTMPPLDQGPTSLFLQQQPANLLGVSSMTNSSTASMLPMHCSMLRSSMMLPGAGQPSLTGGITRMDAPDTSSAVTSADRYQPYSSQIVEEGQLELLGVDMSVSALYMHELHHRRRQQLQQHRQLSMTGSVNSPARSTVRPRPLETIEQEVEEQELEPEIDTSRLTLHVNT